MKTNLGTSILISATIASLLSGCGDKSGPAAPPPEPAALIQGNWQGTCGKPERSGIAESTAVNMSAQEATFTIRNAREADCSLNDIETTYVNKYTVGKAAGEDRMLVPVEYTQVAVKIKPVSEQGASALRIRKYCGTEEWVVGEEKDVTARVDKGDRNCAPRFRKGQTVKIEGDRMYFGDGGSAAQPTTAIDRKQFFVKK